MFSFVCFQICFGATLDSTRGLPLGLHSGITISRADKIWGARIDSRSAMCKLITLSNLSLKSPK